MSHKNYLGQLSSTLAKIHKLLMEFQMARYQHRTGTPLNPATKLNLLLSDPEFAWLRILSQLMVKVDEVYFQKELILDDQVTVLKEEVEELLIRKSNEEFTINFDSLFGQIPELAQEYEKLKAGFQRLH